MIFWLAVIAAWRTAPEPSLTHVSSSGRMVITYGSKRRPSEPARHSYACNAPSRALTVASPLTLDSTASCSLVMMPCDLSVGIPRPLTTPASPKAAPRRSA